MATERVETGTREQGITESLVEKVLMRESLGSRILAIPQPGEKLRGKSSEGAEGVIPKL